jgi:hypothetical protein
MHLPTIFSLFNPTVFETCYVKYTTPDGHKLAQPAFVGKTKPVYVIPDEVYQKGNIY